MATPGVPAPAVGTEQPFYPGMASTIPSASELFSFPGIPGVQSGPASFPGGNPASVAIPSELEEKNGVSPSLGVAGAKPTSHPQTEAKLPASGNAYEFRPDLQPADLGVAKRPLDAQLIRRDFPILEERVHGRPLVWLDNAATTQKPNAVIDRISSFYRHENSNIHRAAHELAARATDAYESAREKSRRFLNASTTREIIFVRGATEGINLVAQAWGRRNVREGDEIVITWLEHHANIVPWQMLCSEKGAKLRVAPVNDRGEIILEEYEKLLGPRTRMVAFPQVSNALGTITPAHEMTEIAHRYGARVLVDGAQAVSHMPVDVQMLGCDFYVFSGHKVFAPTGIGVVYGQLDLLESMAPWQGGGNMIADVTFEKTTYQSSPARFEAGTGNIADAVGLGAALDYVDEIGRENIAAYEHDLLNYGTEKLLTVPGLRLIGTAAEKAGVLSFVLDDVRTEDVGTALNEEGIAVRSGHHCAQPILRRMGVEATVRPSLAFYNTCEDIDALLAALLKLQAARGHRKL
jgi:cysteine desulfurase / selenocysteine lyase